MTEISHVENKLVVRCVHRKSNMNCGSEVLPCDMVPRRGVDNGPAHLDTDGLTDMFTPPVTHAPTLSM